MSWLESKYIGILSVRLRNYKKKSGNLWNFSCPICGDSEKDPRKARAYIYSDKKGDLRFHCHNGCGTSNVPNFIKAVDEFVFDEFIKERFLEEKKSAPEEKFYQPSKPKYIVDTALSDLKKVSTLSETHMCKQYVKERRIPSECHYKLFYSGGFMKWVNSFMPGKFEEKALYYDSPALVLPFLNAEKRMHAVQARFFEGNTRYLTIVIDESVPKIYGLDTYNRDKKSFVLEGPIDSLFLSNAVATAGGTEISALKYLNLENCVMVFDNEPRSKDTIKKIKKFINAGMKVCIWPNGLEHKDVNDCVKAGISRREVREIIETHTFSGLNAELELSRWSLV